MTTELKRLVRQPESTRRAELQERRFGKCIVRTWKRTDGNWSTAPWLFSVQMDGESEIKYLGVPNYCETRHRALMRGWWRAKWKNDGVYTNHYKPSPGMILPGCYKVA